MFCSQKIGPHLIKKDYEFTKWLGALCKSFMTLCSEVIRLDLIKKDHEFSKWLGALYKWSNTLLENYAWHCTFL